MADFQSYIICTCPRSGSTLLCKLLEATGVAGAPGSHFHEPSLDAWLDYYSLSKADYAADLDALTAIFDAARAMGTAETGLFGLRLQRHSFDFFISQLRHLHPDHPTDLARLTAAFGRTLFIHLTRPNKLEQAISRVRAEQTGLWHKNADGTELERLSAPAEPVYDKEAIAGHIAKLTGADAEWNAWFEDEGVEPLRVSYEDLARDPSAELSRILNVLGLKASIASRITPPTAKLSDAISRDWAERYQADTPS